MTVYYVDYVGGDDGTGDGSYSTPYKTIYGASTNETLVGGDELRCAVNTPTALSGTLTYVNGSNAITTSADLTGELSAGDHIGKNTSTEGWWEVSSVTSDTITLLYEYWGTSETTSGYVADITDFTSNNDFRLLDDGTSPTSLLKITGGWDLTTQTQTGRTFLCVAGYYLPYTESREYIELCDFCFFRDTTTAGNFSYFSNWRHTYWHDLSFTVNYNWTPGDYARVEDVVMAGGTVTHFYFNTSALMVRAKNLYSYSAGTGSGDRSLELLQCTVTLENGYFYNGYEGSIEVGAGGVLFGSNIVCDTNSYSSNYALLQIQWAAYVEIKGIDFLNSLGRVIEINSGAIPGCKIWNPTFTDCGTPAIFMDTTTTFPYGPVITIIDYDDVAGDIRGYWSRYDATQAALADMEPDTTDARSGTCVKFNFGDDDDPLLYKLGSYQITSTSSDLTLSVYCKTDGTFNGRLQLFAIQEGVPVVPPEYKTVTSSYAQLTVTVSSTDLVVGEYVHLWMNASAATGSLFFDDFSVG